MSAVAYVPVAEALALDDAVAAVVARAENGQPLALAAAAVFDAEGLDAEATRTTAIRGLAQLAHEALRNRHDEDEAAVRGDEIDRIRGRLHPRRHYAAEHWRHILTENYAGHDGERRALLDFGAEDVTHLQVQAAGKAAGWLRVQAAMDLAAVLLARHRKSRIGDLPEKAQREIAEKLA